MAEVSEIEAGGEVRTVKDTTARQGVAANSAAITEINEKIPATASASNQMATATDVSKSIPTSQSGTLPNGIKWSRWGKVVTITVTGEFTDGQQLDLPFTPLINTTFMLTWITSLVGWGIINVLKKLELHIVTGPNIYGTITYITSDDVY